MIKKEYIPNILTSLRIFLVPIFLFYLLSENYLIAGILFAIASITDWADGYYARKFKAVTNFGIFFDPLADKLLVLSAFYSFLYIDILIMHGSIYMWMIGIILVRDISITLLRIIINLKGNFVLVTSKVAKFKTFLQISTIIFVLFLLQANIELSNHSQLIFSLMFITTFVTLYTGIHYYYNNGKQLFRILFDK